MFSKFKELCRRIMIECRQVLVLVAVLNAATALATGAQKAPDPRMQAPTEYSIGAGDVLQIVDLERGGFLEESLSSIDHTQLRAARDREDAYAAGLVKLLSYGRIDRKLAPAFPAPTFTRFSEEAHP